MPAVALLVVILLAFVQVALAWMGIELAMNPPHPHQENLKRRWRTGFICVALGGIGLAWWQYRVQEKTEAKREQKLDVIDTRTSNTLDFMVRIYDNTAFAASAPIAPPPSPTTGLISEQTASNIVSALTAAKPLETVIWLTSSQAKAEHLAEQIEAMFKRGGFTTAHIVREFPGGQYMFPPQMAAANGIQIETKEPGGHHLVLLCLNLWTVQGRKRSCGQLRQQWHRW